MVKGLIVFVVHAFELESMFVFADFTPAADSVPSLQAKAVHTYAIVYNVSECIPQHSCACRPVKGGAMRPAIIGSASVSHCMCRWRCIPFLCLLFTSLSVSPFLQPPEASSRYGTMCASHRTLTSDQ